MREVMIPDDMDFTLWERETDAKRNVKSASEWVDALIHRLRNPDRRPKVVLPWEKTHKLFDFREGEVTLWSGQNGHGKTGVVSQVALSLMSQGQRVGEASFEMMPMTLVDLMARMWVGTNPYCPEYQGDAGIEALAEAYGEFRDWLQGKFWLYNQQGTTDARNVLGMGRYCAKELGCQHIVIDNLAKCIPDEDDFNAQKRFVDELCALARDNRVHVHLVHHTRKPANENHIPDKHDNKGSGAITDQVDNVMIVWRNKPKEDDVKAKGKMANKRFEADAYLLCRKQRNGDDEPTIQLYFDRDSKQFKGDTMDAVIDFRKWPHEVGR